MVYGKHRGDGKRISCPGTLLFFYLLIGRSVCKLFWIWGRGKIALFKTLASNEIHLSITNLKFWSIYI